MNITIDQLPFASSLHGGEYSVLGMDGSLFPAWCAEQTQSLRLGETIEYTLVDGVAAWGSAASDSLDGLLSWAADQGWPTTVDQNDAIQLSIWSILSGEQGQIDTTGTAITQHTWLLHNECRQDLLIATPISEPSPLPLMLIGVAAIAISRRRWWS